MAFHTVVYTTTIQASDGIKAVPAVTDTIFPLSGNGVLLPCDMRLIAGYAGATTITRARVNAPSLLRVGYTSLRPVQQSPTTPTTPSGAAAANPNMMMLLDSPTMLRSSEAVGVDAASQAGSAERAVAALWFTDRLEPIPPGDSYWLRFTSSTALAATAWTVISPSFDQAIPSGTYAVTGLEFVSPGAVVARVVFPGSVLRPGVLAQPGDLSTGSSGLARTHANFYNGSFGVFGLFQTNAPPYMEIYSVSADNANKQEGYMRVVRVGDIGGLPPAPTGPLPTPPAAAFGNAPAYGAAGASSSSTSLGAYGTKR